MAKPLKQARKPKQRPANQRAMEKKTGRFKTPVRTPSPVRAREKSDLENVPTPGQLRVLKMFQQLTEELGHDPSYREISAALGMGSSGAQEHLDKLVEKGCLEIRTEPVVVGRKLTPLGKRWLNMLG